MKSSVPKIIATILLAIAAQATPAATHQKAVGKSDNPAPAAAITFQQIYYDGRLSDAEARFAVDMSLESTGPTRTGLFDGELALVPPKLPAGLRVERTENHFELIATKTGRFDLKLEVIAKVKRAEPWSQITFKGPAAAIAAVNARAEGADVDLQLLSGTVESSAQTNGATRVKGFLAADQTVAMRWMRTGGTADVERKPVLAAETAVTAQITPTLVKYVTQLRYEIIQGKPTKLLIALPANHALTRLAGDQIRDWEIKPALADATGTNSDRGRLAGPLVTPQVLEVKFLKPIEKKCDLLVYSEQTLESLPTTASLAAPQPLDAERESGTFTIAAEDILAEVDTMAGLRQINAAAGQLAAYRFNSRPFSVSLKLRRIEPVISVVERVALRMEETRVLSSHWLKLNVEKAGIYGLELHPPSGFVVAEARGEGVEDWRMSDGVLHITFSARVLGTRNLEVQLEQSLKSFPDQISGGPLRVAGAAKEHSEVGASAAAGLRLKTAELAGLREVPIRTVQSLADAGGGDEILGYRSEQPDWKLALSSERLSARVIAEVFNLITIGDGIIGGSATIRYGIIGQGVQEFDVSLPQSWKNVEFTGPNIRRKEQRGDGLWRVGLQDKAWDGYTLVVTYDFQFDSKGATLVMGGIHAIGVERETGSVAVTTAASLKLTPAVSNDSLRRVDELELASADRLLVTRPVLLAYQYSQPQYRLEIEAKRYAEVDVLSAVADRTQLTSVLTDAGEMLTQASFMVKNNDKQFQKFKLPPGARFWSCHVNGQPVRAEQDGDGLMAPLPRGANRDQAYAVDIVYAEQKGVKTGLTPHAFALAAPQTDVPNTYAEWQLFAPITYRLSGFGGNMIPVRGTTYDLQDAWQKFTRFYWESLREAGAGLLVGGALILMMVVLIASAIRRGASGVISVLVIFGIIAILAAMLLPALSKAKSRAQRINAMNNLKQIGLAVRTYALDNKDRTPNTWQDMMNELNTDKVTYDPETGQQFIYVGSGLDLEKIHPDSVICYSPVEHGGMRGVLFADGHVEQIGNAKFEELARRGWIVQANGQQIGQNQQLAAVRGAQFQPATIQSLPGAPAVNGQAQTAAAAGEANAQPATGPRMRAIHIDIPKEGQAFVFTKVLNLGGEPLDVSVRIMRMRTFQAIQMILQVSAFVVGVLVCWWQWKRHRNTLVMTVGLALALGAVGSLLLAWRMLHLAMIWLAPILLLAVIAWLTWRFWPRSQTAPAQAPEAGLEPGLPPAVAAIALLFACYAASAEPQAAPGNVSVLSASYTGTIHEQVAELNAVLRVSALKPEQRLRLFGEDVAVQEFAAKPANARLLREGKTVSVFLPGSGETTLQLKLLAKLEGDVTRRQLAFGVPGALTSQLSLTIDQAEAEVEFPGAVSLKRTGLKEQTRIDAVMGSGERVELLWTPRVKRAAEIAANVICQNATLVTLGGGVVNARTILDYQVTQGELRQIRVRVPPGHRLLRVEGDSIRTWQTRTEGSEQTLSVELLKGVAPAYRLTVETERTLETLPAVVPADSAHALDVKRETGLVAVRSEDDLQMNVEQTSELYRVDAEEFSRVFGQKDLGTINAFRFLKPEFSLLTRVSAVQPKIEAVLRNNVWLGQEQVTIDAKVSYTIKRAGVFALRVAAPEGYRIESIQGSNLLQWVERQEADQRVLEVTLKERTLGNYELQLMMTLPVKPLPKNQEIAGVHPLDTEKLTGFISVGVEPGVAIKGSTFDGLTEIPAGGVAAAETSSHLSVLAYKFITTGAQPRTWKLSVETESVESWVRAEIVNTLTIGDDLITGRALARYEVQNAPVKELSLKIPATLKNVEIQGANIRRKDNDGEIWRIEFQSKVRSAQILTVTWEQERVSGTNHVVPQGIGAANVERETGIVAIVARPPLQVTAQDTGDLKPIDLRDLPEWAGQPNEATVLAYRYVRPGYKLALEARRFVEAEVLQVLVEKMNLSTVVADDGQMMTQMSLAVRNQGRQHLEIALPPSARVWSAFVAGQAIRPSEKDGKLLLPLEHSTGDEAPIGIDVVYVDSAKFPQQRGAMDLVSPRLDAPFKSARWELFLPLDYKYSDFSGTMTHEVETAILEPSNFSLLEYSSRESKSKAELAKEVKSEIMSAQTKLSKGKVREAIAEFNRARNKTDLTAKDSDAKQLETELRRAQGGNLIQAQNAFISNNGNFAADGQASQGNPGNSQYDVAAAEAQWTKLQQAQELGIARVQPIRVSLPTRGLRHGFAQLLQTDERGKPMRIHLIASNTRNSTWTSLTFGPLVGFLALWLLVTFFVKYAPLKRPVTA